MQRRSLLKATIAIAASGVLCRGGSVLAQAHAPFVLPPLPYPDNALAPVISSNTIGFHYGKHHKAYLDNLNKLVVGTDLAALSLEEIVKKTAGDAGRAGVFNNAAQVWNHIFYWSSMRPQGGGMPSGMSKHPVKAAGEATLRGLGRRFSGGSFVGDDLAQVVDAISGEGDNTVLADAVNPQAAVFRVHIDRQVVQPVFVLAEEVGDVADREDGADRRHCQARLCEAARGCQFHGSSASRARTG